MKIKHLDPEFTVDIVMTDFSKTPSAGGAVFSNMIDSPLSTSNSAAVAG